MRVGLILTFAIGMIIGAILGFFIFWISLIRGARAVHAEGVLVRAELTSLDAVVGPTLTGPAIVRLSGAFGGEKGVHDILGLELRLQKRAADPSEGDQDLVFGTFNSFRTAAVDKAHTDAGDYLANTFSSVTPWWTTALDRAVTFHLTPPAPGARGRGIDRVGRLEADLAAKTARFKILADEQEVAELNLLSRLDDSNDAASLRVSMFRCGRKIRPLGARNGIRAIVYPISELARRIRGG
jgi:hypothetical protein